MVEVPKKTRKLKEPQSRNGCYTCKYATTRTSTIGSHHVAGAAESDAMAQDRRVCIVRSAADLANTLFGLKTVQN